MAFLSKKTSSANKKNESNKIDADRMKNKIENTFLFKLKNIHGDFGLKELSMFQ